MTNSIELFTRLGAMLCTAEHDSSWSEVIREACRRNPWFTPREIERALHAIACDMLSEEKLREWLSPYTLPVDAPRQVLVVMAGNIPLVGFFDLLCVVASGHRCLVKPSGKDHILMEHIISLMRKIYPAVAVELYDQTQRVDALIATGSDNAARYFKTHYGSIPSLLRGSRQSAAVLDGSETEDDLAGLADDIWAYSGLGCRNVSLIFAPEGYTPKLVMPEMNPKFRNNHLQNRALKRMNGIPFVDLGCGMMVEGNQFPTALSELVICHYHSLAEVSKWLEEHDRELQCIVSRVVDHPRCVGFGLAQRPRLTDYPDAADVLEWLSSLK